MERFGGVPCPDAPEPNEHAGVNRCPKLWAVDTASTPVFDAAAVLEALVGPLNDREVKTLARWDDWLIEYVPMIFNHRIVMTPVYSPFGWDYGWCFHSPHAAALAVCAWNPVREDEPHGWHKRAGSLVRVAPERQPSDPVHCAHGHWLADRDCQYVGCPAWNPDPEPQRRVA